MPIIVLTVLSSVAGAVGVIAGLMLMVGSLNSTDFSQAASTHAADDNWGCYVTLVALILTGIAAQIWQGATMRRTIRETWYVEQARAPAFDRRSPAAGDVHHIRWSIRSGPMTSRVVDFASLGFTEGWHGWAPTAVDCDGS